MTRWGYSGHVDDDPKCRCMGCTYPKCSECGGNHFLKSFADDCCSEIKKAKREAAKTASTTGPITH